MGGLKGRDGETVLGQAWEAAERRCKELRRILDESSQ